ncbi:putative cytosol aminopeptidase [Geomonas sp. Red276]
MRIDVTTSSPLDFATAALVVGCFEDSPDELHSSLDQALGGVLTRLTATREFTGKPGSTHLIHTLGKIAPERVLLAGLGKKGDLDDRRVRNAAGDAVQALRRARIPSFALALHLAASHETGLQVACEGALLGSYSFDEFKTKDREDRFRFDTMTVLVNRNEEAAWEVAHRADAIYRGVQLARDLVSQPGNVATTGYLASAAHELAARSSLSCLVLEADVLESMGMNALLAVGKGSVEPPRLIVTEYNGAGDRIRPTVLVGKGITFDTGGISLKPGAGMEAMKTDMAGAAAVLGTMEAAALMKLPVNLVGIVPTAENMPGGRAYKPGDVITAMSGTTIEITNTDAEGRLVLCDALHYACTHYKPAAVIDLATLTGACVVALGHETAGMMGNDRRLIEDLKRAGERSGERVWEMPLWEEYGELMKSDIADLKNAASTRDGGAISAAWFLKQFVGQNRWVHLDIAGVAWTDKARPDSPKGATGVGVRLLIDFLGGKRYHVPHG